MRWGSRENLVAVAIDRAGIAKTVEGMILEHPVPPVFQQRRVGQLLERLIAMVFLTLLDEWRIVDGVVGAVKQGARKVGRVARGGMQGIAMKETGIARLHFDRHGGRFTLNEFEASRVAAARRTDSYMVDPTVSM